MLLLLKTGFLTPPGSNLLPYKVLCVLQITVFTRHPFSPQVKHIGPCLGNDECLTYASLPNCKLPTEPACVNSNHGYQGVVLLARLGKPH